MSQTKVKDFKYPELFQDTFMEFFERTHTSGSVKDTQEPIKQYLSLQQHRDLSVKDLQSCDWTANENVVVMSAMKDEALDSEDLHALGPVYKELLGLNDTNSLEMPRSIAEFKSVKVESVLYGSQQSQTIRNSFVLANWAGREGTLASNSGSDDVRPGQVLLFFGHCVKVKAVQPHLPDKRYTFFITRVNWYSLHPQRYSHGVPVKIWCNSFDVFGPACFIPVQRIQSNCSIGKIIYNQENVLGVPSYM